MCLFSVRSFSVNYFALHRRSKPVCLCCVFVLQVCFVARAIIHIRIQRLATSSKYQHGRNMNEFPGAAKEYEMIKHPRRMCTHDNF
jgi:hypothetical protein